MPRARPRRPVLRGAACGGAGSNFAGEREIARSPRPAARGGGAEEIPRVAPAAPRPRSARRSEFGISRDVRAVAGDVRSGNGLAGTDEARTRAVRPPERAVGPRAAKDGVRIARVSRRSASSALPRGGGRRGASGSTRGEESVPCADPALGRARRAGAAACPCPIAGR